MLSLYSEAFQLFKQKNYEEALNTFKKCNLEDSDNPFVLQYLAHCEYQLKNFINAFNYCYQAIQLDPYTIPFQEMLGHIIIEAPYQATGTVIEYIQNKLDSNKFISAIYLTEKANRYNKLSNYKDALLLLIDASKAFPSNFRTIRDYAKFVIDKDDRHITNGFSLYQSEIKKLDNNPQEAWEAVSKAFNNAYNAMTYDDKSKKFEVFEKKLLDWHKQYMEDALKHLPSCSKLRIASDASFRVFQV